MGAQKEESCRQTIRSPPPIQEMAATHSLVFCLLLLFSSLAKSSSINRLKGDETRAKRRPEMDTNGFYGDTFSSGFGDFYTAKRNGQGSSPALLRGDQKWIPMGFMATHSP